MSALPEPFLAQLRSSFPADFLSTDPGDLAEYGKDWTKVYPPAPSGVAMPRTTDEVSRLLRLCSEHRVAIVPSGGRTGLSGGAVAAKGELVVSLSRMRRIDPIDLLGTTVRVQAGAITEAVHHHAAEHGLTWPIDFASKGSSQVGGNISTNAGGLKVIRYGLTRNWVLGLQVVLMNGEVLELNGALEKNNTGLDLRQLFIGSEGTLGLITEATLKLTRVPGKLDVLLFALPDLPSVLKLFRAARAGPFNIMAYEFFTDRCMARVEKNRKLRPPFEQPSSHYALLEVERADEGELDAWLAQLFESGLVTDGTRASNATQAAELWSLRESISESLAATGLPHKNDIALPIASLEVFTAALEALLAKSYPDFEICLFGHIGDGNLHVNIMKPDALEKAAFHQRCAQLDPEMFALVREHRGSISAEHGVGLLKRPYLGYSRTEAELAVMRGVKATLDPLGLMNPGKVLP